MEGWLAIDSAVRGIDRGGTGSLGLGSEQESPVLGALITQRQAVCTYKTWAWGMRGGACSDHTWQLPAGATTMGLAIIRPDWQVQSRHRALLRFLRLRRRAPNQAKGKLPGAQTGRAP